MRVEQEQKATEDARIYAEQDAAAQRYAVNVLQVIFQIQLLFKWDAQNETIGRNIQILYINQEKYEAATTSLAEMEERLVMAESMLEATLQYQSGQHKSLPSPRYFILCSNFILCYVIVHPPFV